MTVGSAAFRSGLVILLSLCAAGCCQRQGGVCYPSRERRPANLALGDSAEHARLADALAYRSSWPSVDHGYLLDDVTYHESVTDDYQAFYDRFGGGFIREATTVRSNVLLR